MFLFLKHSFFNFEFRQYKEEQLDTKEYIYMSLNRQYEPPATVKTLRQI